MNDRVTDLQDILKARPNIGVLAGMFLLCTDATGELKKSNATVMEFHTGITDINDITTPGFYQPTSSALNTPNTANSSDQIIYLGKPTYGVMIYIPINGTRIFKRALMSGEWKSWSFLDFTPVSQT